MSYDMKNSKIEIRKTPVIEDIFYDRVTPFTYLDSYANKIPLISESGFKAIYDESHLRKVCLCQTVSDIFLFFKNKIYFSILTTV